MTPNQYWEIEVARVMDLIKIRNLEADSPTISRLLIARQLRDLTTMLDLIRVQLNSIDDSISNS